MEKLISSILEQLTLDEKIFLTHGSSCMGVGPIERLGIQELLMADGPQGIRLEDGRTTTALPCGMALAASFDEKQAEKYGTVIAREALANGIQVSLGPAFNMMRTPMNGRNFEYYGEDPVLAGKIASGYIRGCQSEKVAATPKHLALNNQEICRCISSSNCDERTLRELYLRAFEIVVQEAHPWMLMSSYNKINGIYASACQYTQKTVIKDELGFDGTMVSDWGAVHDVPATANAGLDMEMGSELYRHGLKQAVEDGVVSESVLNEMVRRNLRLLIRTGRIATADFVPGTPECNSPKHRKFALDCAAKGTVLLKNEHNILPLNRSEIKRILITGPNADYTHCMGGYEGCGGSGAVHPDYEITPLAGLREYLGNSVEILYTPGVRFESECNIPAVILRQSNGQPGAKIEYFDNPHCKGTPFVTETITDLHLRWGNFGDAGGKKETALDKRTFSFRITTQIIPDCDGEFKLDYMALRLAGSIKINGKPVLSNFWATPPSASSGVLLNAIKGEAIDIEIEMTRSLIEYSEFSLLWISSQEVEIRQAVELAANVDLVIFFGGRNHSYDREGVMGGDVPHIDIDAWDLPDNQNRLIGELCEANDCVIGCFINGSPFNIAPWIDRVSAMLEFFYGGMEAGRNVARIILGEAVPGGRLPFSWAEKLEDYPCHANGSYPGDRSDASAHTDYLEGMYIGYRHFDRSGVKPVFPFGFGLGYGKPVKMRLKECRKTQDCGAEIAIELSNPNNTEMTAVPQLYIGDEKCSLDRPVKELAAFASVTLQANEEREIVLQVGRRCFSFYDPKQRKFCLEPGEFKLYLGTNAQNIVDSTTIIQSRR